MSRLTEAIHSAADGLETLGARPTRFLQPDPMELRVLVEHARQLLFPEFVGSSHRPSLPLAIGAWANHLINLVATERHRTCPRTDVDPNECDVCLDAADAVATEVVKRLPSLREVLSADLQAALEADPAALGAFEVFLCYPGFLAVTSHRLANALLVNGAPLIARLVAEHAHSRTGVDIHPGAKIEPGFFIDHGTGVVVGETAEIGRSVRLYQGVTLGALSLSKERVKRMHGVKRHPTIEDDVIVYANATILGGDTVIGRGAVIGGNSWVTRSVAPGAIVTTQDITM